MRMRQMLVLLCLGGTLLAGCGRGGGGRGNDQGFGVSDDMRPHPRHVEPAESPPPATGGRY